MPPVPLERVEASRLVREVDTKLIELLRGLAEEDWQRPAVGDWKVRDVTAHLLDGALRRLSLDRDRHRPPAADRDPSDYGALVAFLDELNATWVEASQRLSPTVMVDLLAQVCPQVADYFDSLDPEAEAAFPVSWAGEETSRVWMDVAREYTERWHHQQQIRDAVGAPGIDSEHFLRPLLATLVRALPRTYVSLEAPIGTRILVHVSDLDDSEWVLERAAADWLLGGADGSGRATTTIAITADTAWRLFTKGLDGAEARRRTSVNGDSRWAEPFFTTLAVMA